MKILTNSEIPIVKWNLLLTQSQYSSPFQTHEFYDLFNSLGSQSAYVFGVENDFELRVICVVTLQQEKGALKFFSKRAIIYGGPLIKEKSDSELIYLLNYLPIYFRKKAIYIETRNYFDFSSHSNQYELAKWNYFPNLNIILPIKDMSLEQVSESMKYNRKREIKLSLSEGAYYRSANTLKEVEYLYLILKELYNKKVKLPLPPLEFFNHLYDSSIGKVFIVLKGDKIIGGSFCLLYKKKALYTMYYCGLRNFHKKIFPTHLSILATIDFGIQNGIEYIDFMGAGLKGKEYGVRDYKLQFGGMLIPTGRFKIIICPFLYQIGLLGLKFLKKI